MSPLKDYEISERVAILHKLKRALLAQRDKFSRYLTVLEKQEEDIIERDTERLKAHVELEQSIVGEIFTFQKVIDPLKEIYRMAYPERETEIPKIEESLDHLRRIVLDRNEKNRDLLREHMGVIRKEIVDLRSRKGRKPAWSVPPAPSLIDVRA
jgi:hypothetical protein